MGYYSDVKVSTTQEGFEFLKAQCDKKHQLFQGPEYVLEYDNEKGVVFGWNDVKWYPGFADVDAFMSALNKADDAGFPYEYVEVGEDGATSWQCSSREGACCDYRLTYHVHAVTVIQVTEDE